MSEKPEAHGRAADAAESQSTLGWVGEWLGLSAPTQSKGLDKPLYGPGGAAGIKAEQVIQGDVNDCFFMAPTAAFALDNKDVISKSIQQNKDGTFTVTFAGARDKPVTVAAPTADELKKYAQVGGGGVWPAVMEKAFGKYLKDNPAERDKILGHTTSMGGWFLSDPQEYADAGRAAAVFKLYTGIDPSGVRLAGDHGSSGVRDLLTQAFSGEKHSAVVAGIAKGNQTALQLGLHPEHDYTITGYADGIVTLRDPRAKTENNELGRHMASANGVFTMKVDDFARAFDEVLEARTKPVLSGGGAIMIGRLPFRR